MSACVTPIHWVEETSQRPSCLPNRLPIWKDYSLKEKHGRPSAETAVRFLITKKEPNPQLEVSFDHERSWVKPDFAEPWNPLLWNASELLLAHEQLHFLISCLLTRQANQTLRSGGNPHSMLQLVKAVAQRLNLQYDKDTNHGLKDQAQVEWEKEVQRQLQEVTLQ